MSCRVIIRYGIQTAVTRPSAVPASHSTQSMPTAAGPITLRPRTSVPAPTVIRAIAGAPQNCAITGFEACARARSGYRVQCTTQAAISAHQHRRGQPPYGRGEHAQPGHLQRQDRRGVRHDAGAHDGGEPVRAEVAEHVTRPLQVFEQAERSALIRPPDRARPGEVQSLCHASSLAARRGPR